MTSHPTALKEMGLAQGRALNWLLTLGPHVLQDSRAAPVRREDGQASVKGRLQEQGSISSCTVDSSQPLGHLVTWFQQLSEAMVLPVWIHVQPLARAGQARGSSSKTQPIPFPLLQLMTHSSSPPDPIWYFSSYKDKRPVMHPLFHG